MKQFSLPFPPHCHRFDNYWAESSWLEHIQSCQDDSTPSLIHGPEGSGKTHVLQASSLDCKPSLYINAKQHYHYTPSILDHGNHRVCLDNLDTLLGVPAWEKALFTLIVTNPGSHFLSLTRRQAIEQVKLPDLKSRLLGMTWLDLPQLNDDEKRRAWLGKAHQMGLDLNDAHYAWLIRHCPRDNHTIFGLLRHIKNHCQQHISKPSLALIKQCVSNQ